MKPKYHITAPSNWINDPNGLIKFNGRYHIFYQYHPYSLTWGPMHWGHVVSDDLLHWEHFPIALTPGDEFDKDGCFSGSAIVKDNRLYIFYTGFIFDEDPEKIIQQQCLAYSDDGVNFTKVGLIIGKDNLPKDFAPNDFRDPCVYLEGVKYIMLVAARKIGGKGNILRYESIDLLHWDYITNILPSDSEGTMIECPDYVKDLNLLTYCEQYQPVNGYLHHNIHSSFWKVGNFKNNKFESIKDGMIDYGFDFYAPQIIKDGNILIAWMNMWDRNNPSEKYGFAGSLTIPRKVEVVDNELTQTPVHPQNIEFTKLLNKEYQEQVKVGFYKLELNNLKSFSLEMRKGEKHSTTLKLINNEWVFSRANSGELIIGKETDSDSLNGIRRMPLKNIQKHVIYIVMDEFSIELFIDGKSLTSLIYPDEHDDLLVLNAKCSDGVITKFA